jgi:predicted transcriptional regulator
MTDGWRALVDEETGKALDALARRLNRNPADIASDAIRECVRDTKEMLAALDVAKGQADSGAVMTLEEWRRSRGR